MGPTFRWGPFLCARSWLLVRVVAAAVFEDPANQCHEGEAAGDVCHPEANGEAKESTGTSEAQNQRPPAPRAEVPLLAGAFVDLGVGTVFGSKTDPLTGETKVCTDHARQATDKEDAQDTNPLGPFSQESVGDSHGDEEEDSGSKEPRFDFHLLTSFWSALPKTAAAGDGASAVWTCANSGWCRSSAGRSERIRGKEVKL